jgi:hypothetical protein
MSFFCRLRGKHYWATPHRSADKGLVQVCYECGAERPASALYNEVAAERYNRSVASAKAEMAKLSARSTAEPEQTRATREPIAVGERRTTRFMLIK